ATTSCPTRRSSELDGPLRPFLRGGQAARPRAQGQCAGAEQPQRSASLEIGTGGTDNAHCRFSLGHRLPPGGRSQCCIPHLRMVWISTVRKITFSRSEERRVGKDGRYRWCRVQVA